MKNLNENDSSPKSRWNAFMSEKPLWTFLLIYTALAGIGFGLMLLVIFLLTLKWWVAAIAVVSMGLTWGTLTHRKMSKEQIDKE